MTAGWCASNFATFALFIRHNVSDDPDCALRDSLTVLAILLICLLTAALVGPYLIDFDAHRGLIESKLSHAAGARVTIAGPIRIRLLPQPTFRLSAVTIGETAPGQPSLTVAELDVDVALSALMGGELQLGETVLRSPRLDLAANADGALSLTLPALGDPSRVQLQHVSVVDGTLSVTQPGRPALTVSGLGFDGEAASLLGPFKVTGGFGPTADRHAFRLSTGTFESGKLRLKLSLDASKALPSLDLDGIVTPGGTASQKPGFDGLLTVKGQLPLGEAAAAIPWMLTGHVRATRDKATTTDLAWRAGADMRAVNATGGGEMILAPGLPTKLRLRAPQLNLDALAVAPEASRLPPPKGGALLSALNAALGASRLPLALDVDYGFDTVTSGPLTLLGMAGRVALDGAKPAKVSLAAQGPDAARLALDGLFEGGVAPVFRGRLDAGVRDLPRLAAWLAPVLPEATLRTLRAIPARALSIVGDVDLSGVGIAARDAAFGLDQSLFKGTLTYTRAVGADRARLFADLSSDGIDLDDLPDVGPTSGLWSDVDLDLAVAARAVKIVPTGIGAVDAGRLGFRLHKTGDTAVLDEASADLGSARLMATGRLDRESATLDVHADAPQLDALADLLAKLWPGTPTAALRERASALSPTLVDVGVRATRMGDGSLLPTALVIDATAKGSRIKATLKPDNPGEFDAETSVFSADLDADASQGLVLLHQLGLPAPPTGALPQGLGAGRIKGRVHGSAADGFEASVDASLGGAVVSFQGRAKAERGSGHLSLKCGDLAPLLRSAGLLTTQAGAALWPADADADVAWHAGDLSFHRLRGMLGPSGFSGDLSAALATAPAGSPEKPALFGTLTLDRLSTPLLLDAALGPASPEGTGLWSSGAFGIPLVSWPSTEIAIKAKVLTVRDKLDAGDASLTLRADRHAVTLADITGTLGLGTIGGSLTLRRDGPSASVTGRVSWSGIALDWPGIAGRTGGTLDFGGSGSSPSALVAGLAGAGSVTIGGGRIAKLDPAGLSRTAVAAESDTSDVDAAQIRDKILPELDRAPLRLGDVAGQATLATGIFRVGPLRAVRGDVTVDAGAAIDLEDLSFSSKTVLSVRQPLPDWKGEAPQVTLSLNGPIDMPHREVDVAAFVNALQSRAIQRDQERIDTMQQDIRERAFFNRRFKAIEAEQAAVRQKAKAAADAAAGAAEISRQMRQNQPGGRLPVPLPLSRPPAKSNRPPRSALPDPASAGPY